VTVLLPHFVVVSTDWRVDQVGQYNFKVYAHGIFRNVGTGTGSVPVVFQLAAFSGAPYGQCSSVIPIAPPGSAAETSCYLSGIVDGYYLSHPTVDMGLPSAAVMNP
jgi:hypothetical protein